MDAVRDSSEIVEFGPFELDRAARELRRQGRRIRLQEQPFLVLSLLLDRAGDVVTREELRRELWPASVYVDFDHGLNNAIARLREHLGDSAASPRFIETLPRLGYRFVCPIRTSLPTNGAGVHREADEAVGQRETHEAKRSYAAAFAIVGVLALALAGVWLARRSDTEIVPAASPGRASIAVLPFVSMSSEPEDEHFADGLSEELLNQLAHIDGLDVAGRTSSYFYKGKQESPAVIAKALHVDHLLEGSVRRAGDRVRVTAQLIDARSGFHVWSETFDRDFAAIFEIQDDIALSVASALRVQLLPDGQDRLTRYGTRNPDAYRLYLIGMAQRKGRAVRQDVEASRRSFELAIALDPNFAAAYAGLSSYYFHLAAVSLVSTEEGARRGLAAAERAIALDPDGAESLRAAADFEMWKFRFLGDLAARARSQAYFERAVAADSTNTNVIFNYARALSWIDPERAQAMFERANALDPLARFSAVMAAGAMSRRGMGDDARRRLEQVVARSPDWRWGAALGSFEAYHGRLDVAVSHLKASAFVEQKIELWAVYRSLGDREAASDLLRTFEGDALVETLRQPAGLVMQGEHRQAFEYLDRAREAFAESRILDAPTARLALIVGEAERARLILERRLPDLAAGRGPVMAPHVIPALDLVLAWSMTGRAELAQGLLARIVASFENARAPQLPMFGVLRARAHLLAGAPDLAKRSLERAYDDGFRMTCALDLHPQPLLYIDCLDDDAAFAALRRDGWFDGWLARIRADNHRQLDAMRTPTDRDLRSEDLDSVDAGDRKPLTVE